MRALAMVIGLLLTGCGGGVMLERGGADDPSNPDAPEGEMAEVSQTLAVRDRPATQPAEEKKGGHGHHAH